MAAASLTYLPMVASALLPGPAVPAQARPHATPAPGGTGNPATSLSPIDQYQVSGANHPMNEGAGPTTWPVAPGSGVNATTAPVRPGRQTSPIRRAPRTSPPGRLPGTATPLPSATGPGQLTIPAGPDLSVDLIIGAAG